MRLGRFSVLAASSVLTAGALIGVPAAGTASAASYTYLCSDDLQGYGADTYSPYTEYCIDSANGTGVPAETVPEYTNSLTNWTYPNSPGAVGAIRQADNVNYCLQVDASLNDEVIGASCVGDSAEKWTNVYNSAYGATMFESDYNSGLCLTVIDASDGGSALQAAPCGGNGGGTPWEELWRTK
jgi:Ricin-type beta-trefoil lectin domain